MVFLSFWNFENLINWSALTGDHPKNGVSTLKSIAPTVQSVLEQQFCENSVKGYDCYGCVTVVEK